MDIVQDFIIAVYFQIIKNTENCSEGRLFILALKIFLYSCMLQ